MVEKRKIFAAALALLILLQLFAGCHVTDQAPSGEPSGDTSNSENDNTQSNGTEGNENESTPSDDADKGVELTDVTFYGYANDWVGEEFLNENRVFYAYYPDNESEGEFFLELNEPRTKTFIVTTEEEYRNLFPSDPIDVDFEKEMVILYISATAYPQKTREHYLKKAVLCDDVLTVTVKPEPNGEEILDYGGTYPRCFALKMEKAEITEVIFKGIVIVYPPDEMFGN